ncbi:hypothetical protein NDI85_03990 [Halomicroarcula sp. S1AR25-4]|uniref:HTH domain-containing protein n=1 Tax=Haloarcula sp. S1AR25-4 TaxID=2950538 RepID=UPI002877226D|nr:HTH domain-containing protein [Halomicroarcula sp. S1AR25-4]MDS0276939.1 hypothetical protein [Halomicroarcula sp. S1AR25-4]
MTDDDHYRADGSSEAPAKSERTDDCVRLDQFLDQSTDAVTIELWLREGTGHTVRDVQAQYRQQTTALETSPQVADVTIRTWPTRLFRDLDQEAVSGPVHRAVREMETWASENGYSLAPAFQRRVVRSPLSGRRREEVTLPIVCLAIHGDAGLEGVFPARHDGVVYTVEDFYEAIRDTASEDQVADSATVGAE